METAAASAPNVSQEDADTVQKAVVQTVKARLEWLRDIEQVALAYGAKTVKEVHPTINDGMIQRGPNRGFHGYHPAPITPASGDSKPIPLEYKLYRDSYQQDPVPAHLRGLYAELFVACWKGDAATIERLCLPPKDGKRAKDATYLQITSYATIGTGTKGLSSFGGSGK